MVAKWFCGKTCNTLFVGVEKKRKKESSTAFRSLPNQMKQSHLSTSRVPYGPNPAHDEPNQLVLIWVKFWRPSLAGLDFRFFSCEEEGS